MQISLKPALAATGLVARTRHAPGMEAPSCSGQCILAQRTPAVRVTALGGSLPSRCPLRRLVRLQAGDDEQPTDSRTGTGLLDRKPSDPTYIAGYDIEQKDIWENDIVGNLLKGSAVVLSASFVVVMLYLATPLIHYVTAIYGTVASGGEPGSAFDEELLTGGGSGGSSVPAAAVVEAPATAAAVVEATVPVSPVAAEEEPAPLAPVQAAVTKQPVSVAPPATAPATEAGPASEVGPAPTPAPPEAPPAAAAPAAAGTAPEPAVSVAPKAAAPETPASPPATEAVPPRADANPAPVPEAAAATPGTSGQLSPLAAIVSPPAAVPGAGDSGLQGPVVCLVCQEAVQQAMPGQPLYCKLCPTPQ